MLAKKLPLDIQDRDLAVLRGLFESRVMTAGHISSLYFDGKPPATRKRLWKLKTAGLIRERARRVNEPAVYVLTRKGFDLLHEQAALAGFPQLTGSSFERRANVSDLTIHHELEIMDVKTAFHAALAASDVFTIAEFGTWPLLYQFEAVRPGRGGREAPVKPDGFIRVHEKEEGAKGFVRDYFLEVDRSSELQDRLLGQARCYFDYYYSGGYAIRNGGARSDFKAFPFRVLFVCKTAERRNNTAEHLLQCSPPILNLICLATFEEATADPLGAIWLYPSEYRQATKDTPFDAERKRPSLIYRRNAERDAFIETNVQKKRLFD